MPKLAAFPGLAPFSQAFQPCPYPGHGWSRCCPWCGVARGEPERIYPYMARWQGQLVTVLRAGRPAPAGFPLVIVRLENQLLFSAPAAAVIPTGGRLRW